MLLERVLLSWFICFFADFFETARLLLLNGAYLLRKIYNCKNTDKIVIRELS
jgi:hypothetical protein